MRRPEHARSRQRRRLELHRHPHHPGRTVITSGVGLTSPVVSVQSGQTRWLGPIDAVTFADTTTGLCTITYSQGTVTVAAVQLTQP